MSYIPRAAVPTVGYASLLSVAGGRKRENACELKSDTLWHFGQAILTMLVIKSLLIERDRMPVSRLEICQKIYRTEDFRVKNLHRKRVIFDIC